MARRKPAMRSKRTSNKPSMILVSTVVIMILVVICIKNNELKEKMAEYDKREEYLLSEIKVQEERTQDIEEYRKYMKTMQYIEDMAKSRLGLVYEDEIIIEADE